ncbi:MAG: hypothetical protein M3305_07025 [Actinomycetota bacterium]|nr:hypothetical protein [Actinomycetota bacterium]
MQADNSHPQPCVERVQNILVAEGAAPAGYRTLELPNGREWYATYNPRGVTLGVRKA